MRRLATAAISAALAASVLVLAAPDGAHADDRDAQQLLRAAQDAATDHEFTGTVKVQWRDGDRLREQTIEVSSDDGVLHLGDDRLVGAGNRRLVKSDHGWQLLWAAPPHGREPDPSAKYRFQLSPGRSVAARPTTAVVIRRGSSDDVRERLFFDDATGMLLRRDQFDDHGRVVRQFAFVALSQPRPAPAPASDDLPKAAARSRRDAANLIDDAPDHLTAPKKIGRGFALSGVYSQSNGSVHLYYSDGLLGLSVFEREGPLDWSALPRGGRTVDLDGTRARIYSTVAGSAAVWTSDDITYTSVTDAAPDELASIVKSMDDADDPGMMERVGRFITRPFSWG